MFTGLIQSIGRILSLEKKGADARMRLQAQKPFSSLRLGESIAVNGVCLTVEDFAGPWFAVYASAETLQTTTLGQMRTGGTVNLERALTLQDFVGGHLVSGHVDCQARVSALSAEGSSTRYVLEFAPSWSDLVVAKGSVALDGISLTVNTCGPGFLEVNIIPATARETTVAGWKAGAFVNMETDLIGKYVQRMLRPWSQAASNEVPSASGLSLDFLKQHGFGGGRD